MEVGQRSEAGARLRSLNQPSRAGGAGAAAALPAAALGRCSRARGEEKADLDLPSGRPLFSFVCTFFFRYLSASFSRSCHFT